MLNALRKSASTWVAKVLIGLLVLSFAVWGVNDFIGGINRTTIATVGETTVSAERFDRALSIEISRLQRQIQQPVSRSQAVAFGIPNQVISQLVTEAALDDVASKLNLGVSDEKLRDDITENPAFTGPDGRFDRSFLQQILQSNSMTEKQFVADQRAFSERRQIAEGVSGGASVPETLLKAIHVFRNESRTIRTIALESNDLQEIPAPSEQDLTSYFDDNKARYRAPEYRSVSLIRLTLDDVMDAEAVSDDDARRIYDERKDRFSEPEKRRVEQLVFPDKEEADAAKAKLNEGTDWETLLEQRGVAPGDIDLGLVAREDIIDQSVADAVFSMAEGSVSDVIEGRFGPILARVTDIQLASTRPFEEVAGDIKQEIARDEAIDQIFSVRDAVEDSIAGGASLAEVATANGLTLRQVAAVSETGLDESDTVITDLPLSAELISGMYASDIGIENPPLEGDNEFVWYEVTGVTPERERTLEEVSDRVQEDWIRDETAKALDALASSLAGNLKSDVSFTALAEARDKPITPYEGITRLEGKEGLAAANIATIFEAKADSFGFLTPADPTQRLLFQVTEVTVPAYFEEEQSARQIAEAVAPAIENELLVQYVAELQTNLGVSLNQALLSQMLAGTPDQRR
mgnify:FL=1|tara:strand:- start:16058 stop:17959 length:1902 start_codon:yes stop_codon:yes gene_type:complete